MNCSDNLYICTCGTPSGKNGMLCDACEKELLLKIDNLFYEEEIAYLKEVYYLKP